ncbi:yersiniabactin non-ribosomal peptide synthetase, partial [Pseudomonas syringae pv. actinidiae ICMP 18807]
NFPSLHAFAATLVEHNAPATVRLEHDPAGRYQPFALSEVQQAYLVGTPGSASSNVTTFCVPWSVTACCTCCSRSRPSFPGGIGWPRWRA